MSARKPTPKQILASHIRNDHRRRPAKSMTFAELQRWHVAQHHRYAVNHFHAGPNHPDERPPGWYTGEDVVPRR
jgi:hypothetical protein